MSNYKTPLPDPLPSLGNLLSYLGTIRGYSDFQLMCYTGLGRKVIGNILKDKTWPDKETLQKICDSLQLSVEEKEALFKVHQRGPLPKNSKPENTNYFGDALREVMHRRGISALELYRKSGIDNGTLSRYLNGKNLPYAGTLRRILKALNCTEEEITQLYASYHVSKRQPGSKRNKPAGGKGSSAEQKKLCDRYGANLLRYLVTLKAVSPQTLEKDSGINTKSIFKALRGYTRPRAETLEKLFNALSLSKEERDAVYAAYSGDFRPAGTLVWGNLPKDKPIPPLMAATTLSYLMGIRGHTIRSLAGKCGISYSAAKNIFERDHATWPTTLAPVFEELQCPKEYQTAIQRSLGLASTQASPKDVPSAYASGKKRFGSLLQEMARAKCILPNELARTAGLNEGTLSRLFSGERTHIRPRTLGKILASVDWSPEQLAALFNAYHNFERKKAELTNVFLETARKPSGVEVLKGQAERARNLQSIENTLLSHGLTFQRSLTKGDALIDFHVEYPDGHRVAIHSTATLPQPQAHGIGQIIQQAYYPDTILLVGSHPVEGNIQTLQEGIQLCGLPDLSPQLSQWEQEHALGLER